MIGTFLWSTYTKEKQLIVTVMNGLGADSWPLVFSSEYFWSCATSLIIYAEIHGVPWTSHHHLPPGLQPAASPWAKVNRHWQNDISDGLWQSWNVRMPILPWFSNGFSLYLKSDLMLDVVVSCCLLGTCKITSRPCWHWLRDFPEAGVGDSQLYPDSCCVLTCNKIDVGGS